ncbi:MAG: spore cortex biosynthesis protein YabQ [Oscillospiraceae bacterium]
MGNPISEQAAQAALALIAGVALGLAYDLVKAFRLKLRSPFFTASADVLFCLAAALGLFAFGLGPGGGQLRIFMLIFIGVGTAVYAGLISSTALPVFGAFAGATMRSIRVLLRPAVKIAAKTKIIAQKAKNVFQKIITWFTITNSYRHMSPKGGDSEGGGGFETEKGKYLYEACHIDRCSLRGDKSCDSAGAGRRGGKAASGTEHSGCRNGAKKRRARISARPWRG